MSNFKKFCNDVTNDINKKGNETMKNKKKINKVELAERLGIAASLSNIGFLAYGLSAVVKSSTKALKMSVVGTAIGYGIEVAAQTYIAYKEHEDEQATDRQDVDVVDLYDDIDDLDDEEDDDTEELEDEQAIYRQEDTNDLDKTEDDSIDEHTEELADNVVDALHLESEES